MDPPANIVQLQPAGNEVATNVSHFEIDQIHDSYPWPTVVGLQTKVFDIWDIIQAMPNNTTHVPVPVLRWFFTMGPPPSEVQFVTPLYIHTVAGEVVDGFCTIIKFADAYKVPVVSKHVLSLFVEANIMLKKMYNHQGNPLVSFDDVAFRLACEIKKLMEIKIAVSYESHWHHIPSWVYMFLRFAAVGRMSSECGRDNLPKQSCYDDKIKRLRWSSCGTTEYYTAQYNFFEKLHIHGSNLNSMTPEMFRKLTGNKVIMAADLAGVVSPLKYLFRNTIDAYNNQDMDQFPTPDMFQYLVGNYFD